MDDDSHLGRRWVSGEIEIDIGFDRVHSLLTICLLQILWNMKGYCSIVCVHCPVKTGLRLLA